MVALGFRAYGKPYLITDFSMSSTIRLPWEK